MRPPGSSLDRVTAAAPAFRWRTAAVAIYGPSIVFAIGEGAVLPMIPHIAEDLGATLAFAGLIVAVVTIGELLGTLPAGWLLPRIGERLAMILASVLALVGSTIAFFAPNPILLAVGVLFIGVAGSIFQIARQAFLTVYVPLSHRARALSTLGGTLRFGLSVGPLIIAAIIAAGGGPTASFILQGVAAVGIIVLLLCLKDPQHTMAAMDAEQTERIEAVQRPEGMLATFRRNRRVLGTIGVGAAALSALRQSRQMILPLWAVAIGLSPDSTALIIGIAGFIDFALFYTGGWVMDRFGRMWIVMPVTIGLSIGHILLAVTGLLPWPVVWFAIMAGVLSVANGLGSGVLMTLSADLAEPENPAPFLAIWRLLQGLGGAAAPLIISGVTAIASLPIAAVTIGVLGLGGAWIFGTSLRRYDPRAATGAPGADGPAEAKPA